MKCPKCGGKLFVCTTEDTGSRVNRRRDCEKCGRHWTSVEKVTEEYIMKRPRGEEALR